MVQHRATTTRRTSRGACARGQHGFHLEERSGQQVPAREGRVSRHREREGCTREPLLRHKKVLVIPDRAGNESGHEHRPRVLFFLAQDCGKPVGCAQWQVSCGLHACSLASHIADTILVYLYLYIMHTMPCNSGHHSHYATHASRSRG